MNPKSAYPCSIPFSRESALLFLRGDQAFSALCGAYLCFVMIPVEERIGEWRLAGAADSLSGVLTALESFNQALRCEDLSYAKWVEDMDMDLAASWSFDSLPLGKQEDREHQVILFAEGGAPYDHAGLAILEIRALAGSSFASRAPETERPSAWDGGSDHEDDDEDDDDEA